MTKDGLRELDSKADMVERLNDFVDRKPAANFCVAYLDIDHFDDLNRSLGREICDDLLTQFSQVVRRNSRQQDHVAHYGGDEFVILLPDTQKEEALIFVEDIRRAISDKTFKLTAGNSKVTPKQITCSVGIASYPNDAKDRVGLTRRADNALFMAKKYGRNRICLAVEDKMVLKSNYYTKGQLDRLAKIAKKRDVTEAFLLREAVDMIIDIYEQKLIDEAKTR